MANRALECYNIANKVNEQLKHNDKIIQMAHNICNLCEAEAEKGKYSLYLPDRHHLKLSIEDYKDMVELLRKEGFGAIYDEWEEAYYVSWKNVKPS